MSQVTSGAPPPLAAERRRLVVVPGLLLVLVGLTVLLVGWVGGVDQVTRVLPTLESMKVNTAIGILLLGVVALSSGRVGWPQRVAMAAAAIVALLGLATALEYLTDVDLGIDNVLIPDTEPGATAPGRMGLNTAGVFLSLGAGWLLAGLTDASRIRHLLMRVLWVVAAFLCVLPALAYLLGVRATQGLGSATEMALHTSLSLIVATASLAIAASYSGQMAVLWDDGFAGQATRRLLLAATLTLVVVGGLTELAARLDVVDSVTMQLALATTLSVGIVAAAILLIGDQLVQAERHLVTTRRELEQVNTELEDRVAERTAELEGLLDDLRRSNDDLSQFAQAASHDLKEPLRMVSAYCQRLDAAYADVLDERGRVYLDYAVEGANRMALLVDGLERYTRVGSQTLVKVDIHLDSLLDDALARTGMLMAGVRLVRTGGLPVVRVDRELVTLALEGVLSNALRFHDEDADHVVRLTGAVQGDHVRLDIADTGIGIPEEHQERIFEMFRRLNARERFPGIGVGLPVARRIVRRHGGDITIRSADPTGTIVALLLPLAAGTMRDPDPSSSEGAHDGAARTTGSGADSR